MAENFWVLSVSYTVHLIATVVWFGGLIVMAAMALPALRQGTLSANQWLALQKRFAPWTTGSLIFLLISGFVQMTNDVNYSGFLVIDGVWAWAMLIKHVAFGALALLTAYMQFSLYPAMERTAVLAAQRPKIAAAEQEKLSRQEGRLLRLNLLCALIILICTAAATAV